MTEPVPDQYPWELFYMRMTFLLMAQTRAGFKGASEIDSDDIAVCAGSVNTYWNTIV